MIINFFFNFNKLVRLFFCTEVHFFFAQGPFLCTTVSLFCFFIKKKTSKCSQLIYYCKCVQTFSMRKLITDFCYYYYYLISESPILQILFVTIIQRIFQISFYFSLYYLYSKFLENKLLNFYEISTSMLEVVHNF